MKNFDLVNYLKNNSLINEIKAVGTGYLEIKLTPESEYGDDRDREKIIIPKYSYRLDKDSIDFLQSKETIIPEEEGFFPYLYAVLEEYLERSKREDLTKLSVRNQLVQDLINDLYLYIEANGVTSLGDTSPRDNVYYIFEKFLDKIFPDLSEDWSEYFERGAGIDALEDNDSEYFINTWFGGDNENDDINEAIAPCAPYPDGTKTIPFSTGPKSTDFICLPANTKLFQNGVALKPKTTAVAPAPRFGAQPLTK